MKNTGLKVYIVAGLLLAMALFSVLGYKNGWTPAWKPLDILNSAEDNDHRAGYLVNITDEGGNVICKVSRGVSAGDEIIQSDGKHYRITRVGGNHARAKLLGTDQEYMAYCDFYAGMAVPAAAIARDGRNLVGIYHTHSGESYVPTEGTESIPFRGGIYKVGQSLANKLQNENVRVDYDRTTTTPITAPGEQPPG